MPFNRQAAIDELVELGENRQHLEALTPAGLAHWATRALLDQLLATVAQSQLRDPEGH